MLLILGHSYAAHLESRVALDNRMQAIGWRGARVSDEHFQRWAIQQALQRQPQRVALLVGGNDLSQPQFRQRSFIQQLHQLCLGLLAAGAEGIVVFSIMPRDRMRDGDVSRNTYRHRRHLCNKSSARNSDTRLSSATSFPHRLGFWAGTGFTHLRMGGWSWSPPSRRMPNHKLSIGW